MLDSRSLLDKSQTFVTYILLTSVFVLLYFSLKRRKISQLIPCRKQRFIDILGDLSNFCFGRSNCNGYPITTFFWQYLEGYTELFKGKKLYVFWLGYTKLAMLNKPEAIEEILKSTTVIKKSWVYNWLHPWLATGLLTSHGEKWRSRRKLLTPAFHFDILKDFMPIIQEKSMQLVEKLKEGLDKDYIDIHTPVTLCSLDIICETTLGVDIKAQENSQSEYVKAVQRTTDGITKRTFNYLHWLDFTYFLTPTGRAAKRDINLLKNFTMEVIKEKKNRLKTTDFVQSKRKPLIDVLLEHHLQTKQLTEEDIREEVDTFAFEGHDTTSSAMVWTLYLIGLYKDVQNKLQQELELIFGENVDEKISMTDLKDMNYLECVIKESMRLYPPVSGIGRESDKDVSICNYTIPPGTPIVIFPYNVHRDPEIYPNPEVFDPERFSPENSAKRHHFAYIPFSAGPRNCIGQKLAMMEIKTVVANILRNFELKSLDPRDKMLPTYEVILRPAFPVRMKLLLRNKHIN